MSIPWTEFFEALRGRQPSLFAFAFNWWLYNVPLLERIREVVPPPAKILEMGTGTGALAVLLAGHGYDVLGIDNDPQVVQRARGFAEHFRVPCRFEVGDGFDLSAYAGAFDLAFSSGVIEHFPPTEAARLLRQQGGAARYVLAAVPTWHALRNDPLTKMSGARPIQLGELKRLFADAGLEVIAAFGFGTPDGRFSWVYRHLFPQVVQWVLQNRLSYAATVACVGRTRRGGPLPSVGRISP